MTSQLFIDSRYQGNHGIARYAHEVIARLTLDFEPFTSTIEPGSPRDALSPSRLRLPRTGLLYSPGYSTGIARCRQILTIHDLTHIRISNPRRRKANQAYYDLVVKPVIKQAGTVITISETSAREIREWIDDDSVSVVDCGNGCSEIFTPEGAATALDRPYFLYVGNLKEHKNPAPVFAAMRQFPDHLLCIVSPDETSARQLAAEHSIADRIRHMSDISDESLARLYRGSVALTFPSTWEGFGLPVAEAIRTHTNVVYCQEADSVAEICDNTQFAVHDSHDPGEFAAQMHKAATTPFTPSDDHHKYDWSDVARRIEKAIRTTECASH